jgi:Calcineurin-like phosphoesterase
MQFLHFTDLHYKHESPFQVELIRRLLPDLKAARDQSFNIEALVFSGDLVDNPDDPNIYSLFEANFLRPVLDAVDLNDSMVVLCPGNHDISWAAQKARKLAYTSIQATLGNQDSLSDQVKQEDFCAYTKDIASGFFALASRYGGPWSNPFYKVYHFGAKKISFVAFNSAFGCSLDGSAADRGKLALSAETALAAFHSVQKEHKAISLVHHTFGDMTEGTARHLVPIIEAHSIAHCFGHVHQPKPTTSKSSSGSCFYIQGGALYEKHGYYNGYSIIRVSDSREFIEAYYRSYYFDRHEFDDGTNISHGGRFYNSDASETYWKRLVPPPSQTEVCSFLQETLESVCTALNSTIIDQKLRDSFAEPRLVRPSQKEEETDGPSEIPYQFYRLLTSGDHVVIGADNGFGATSLLRYLTMEFYFKCAEMQSAKVPALVDARQFKARPYAHDSPHFK